MKFDELIAQHCPKGVELKYLWEITVWDKRFNGISKSWQPQVLSFNHISAAKLKQLEMPDGDVKLLSTGKFGGFTSSELAGDNLNEGEVIAIPSGGSASLKYFNGKFVDSGNILCSSKDNSILSLKYLYHYLLSINNLIEDLFRGPGVKHPSMPDILQLRIPVPPIKIQQEIVRILDAFTALTAELTAELTARKKQYNYYRDQLLTFDENERHSFLEKLLDGAEVEWLPLGDVTQYEQPTKYLVKTTNYRDEYKTPVLTAGKTFILGYTDETDGINKASENPVIIFDDFTTANKWVDFDFKAKSSAMKMITSSDDSKFILKYIYYWMNTLPSELADGDHKRQWISNFCNKEIPIPCPDDPKKSLAIQAEIVRILDKFDALTNSLQESLPREIELRQKQYEYYRDLLLNFPKPMKQAA